MKTTQAKLTELALSISADLWGESKPWGGAGIGIVKELPNNKLSGFYPDSRYLITQHIEEASWLFNQLRNIAIHLDEYRNWKDEFFQRLGAAGQLVPADESAKILLFAILREAFEILDMVEAGMTMPDFAYSVIHPRIVGGDIVDFDKENLNDFYNTRGIAIS